jgi:hypothetical protein
MDQQYTLARALQEITTLRSHLYNPMMVSSIIVARF